MSARKEVPAWPKTVRIVVEDCNWDEGPIFTCLQPDEEPPAEALGMAVYELVGAKIQ